MQQAAPPSRASRKRVLDVSRLYTLALEKGVPGALYHALGGEVPDRRGGRARHGVHDPKPLERGGVRWLGSVRHAHHGVVEPLARTPGARRARLAEKTDMLTMIGEPRLRALAAREPAAA